ncbi:MAG: hypothetical protein ABI068_01610 [Ktedonobacterales bacterium]
MNGNTGIIIFEALAALCALVAAVFIFDAHIQRPRPHKLMWSLGLLYYGIAAAAAWAGTAWGWNVAEYKLWYLFGGVMTAAYLGLGSLYLLAPRHIGHIATTIAALISIYAAVRILAFSVPAATTEALAHASTTNVTNVAKFNVFSSSLQTATVLDLRLAAIVMNIPGALLLFGGAAWSAWQFYRKHFPRYRLISMALLALGAIFPSILTGLQALGFTSAAALGEFLGAICLLTGLLISLDVFTVFRVPFTHIVVYERQPQPLPLSQQPVNLGS